MADDIQVIAGECTTTFEGTRNREQRGHVVVVVKPDKTVLVHDAEGYQPVAWLTRPETLLVERDPVSVRAADGDQRLRVIVHDEAWSDHYTVSTAGVPVGECPDCDGSLVRASGTVACMGCETRYGLPSGASVMEERCEDCDLPLVAVDRGNAFEVCVDRGCEPLADVVRDQFDGAWTCPDCESDLRVLRRGGLIAGCERYPGCDNGFAIPDGIVVGSCDCGLPVFETANGQRCMDTSCKRVGT